MFLQSTLNHPVVELFQTKMYAMKLCSLVLLSCLCLRLQLHVIMYLSLQTGVGRLDYSLHIMGLPLVGLLL